MPQTRARVDAASGTTEDSAEPLGLRSQDWYPTFLSGIRGVAADGTAAGLGDAWRRLDLPWSVFVKTGTLAEPGEAGAADDLFIKSLLFAVGEGGESGAEPLGCGLVGGIYLRFKEGPVRGSLPSYQVEFARERLGDFLKDNWERFGACEEAAVGVGEPGGNEP